VVVAVGTVTGVDVIVVVGGLVVGACVVVIVVVVLGVVVCVVKLMAVIYDINLNVHLCFMCVGF
jgi:hypothetical protein